MERKPSCTEGSAPEFMVTWLPYTSQFDAPFPCAPTVSAEWIVGRALVMVLLRNTIAAIGPQPSTAPLPVSVMVVTDMVLSSTNMLFLVPCWLAGGLGSMAPKICTITNDVALLNVLWSIEP